jgi:hypothetical protein
MKNYKNYLKSGLIAIFALTLSVLGSANAEELVPYKSRGVASLFALPVPDEVVSGIDFGNATHLGKYHSTLDLLVSAGSNGIRFVGPTTIFCANGDEVQSVLDVELDLATNTITGTYTVVGGTGRWDGAGGGGVLTGAVNADGTFSYTTNGSISRPKRRK